MPEHLGIARQQFSEGNSKKAVETLWRVEAKARTNLDQARGLLELASAIRDKTDGRVRKDCDLLIERAQTAIGRMDFTGTIYEGAVAIVRRCRVLGGHGFAVRVGEIWELIFTEGALQLHGIKDEVATIPYEDMTAIEIGGPGETRSGGGFFGGGFGLEGAVEGMLIATALNMLTTRTNIDTVICIQTQTAELFFHNGETAPQALRMLLSPIFSRLRQQQRAFENRSDGAPTTGVQDVVDRLAKLADLLERGLISGDDFQKVKEDLLR